MIRLRTAGWFCSPRRRWWHPVLRPLLGDDFFGKLAGFSAGSASIVLAIALYDLATRRRIHAAWAAAAAFYAVAELLSIWAIISPWWPPMARALLGV
ncbi:hypothetical protein [Novosphingobium aerophilum]|uniref:hypothetical protein n=1 Tax=Novosphingobium aerophilum TaxID=2839843 RepID=UPI00163ADAA6|nr:hypothetical protein [Novosphingobium aerophilum]